MKSFYYLPVLILVSLFSACTDIPLIDSKIDSLSKKPQPPAPTSPLSLLDNGNQITGISGGIKVWTYSGGTYAQTWEKSSTYQLSAIGDTDNDSNDELAAVYTYTTGRGKNKVRHTEIHIFEDGDTDTPSRISGDLFNEGVYGYMYMRLADVNNDGHWEILISSSSCISVYKDDGNLITRLWGSEDLSAVDPWSIDAGDADNDGQDEIIYAELGSGRFGVYEYLGGNNWGNKIYSEQVFCGLDRAFAADVDGDGDNEVIGGGCWSRLYIWEYTEGEYLVAYQSEDLGGFTQGIGAGDFDNDGMNEIAVGTAGGEDKVYVFKNLNSTYSIIYEGSIGAGVSDLFAGDSDNDGTDEFAVATGDNLLIYDFINGYTIAYSSPGSTYPVIIN